MANYFKIKHGFVSTGDGSITGILDVSAGININGAAVATQSWVSGQGFATSGSVSGNYLALSGGTLTGELVLDYNNPALVFKGDDGIWYRLRVDESGNQLELGHTSNIGLKLSNSGGVTFPQLGAGFVKTNASGVVSIDTNTYLTSVPSEYLTQTEGDARYLRLTGGTLTGNINANGSILGDGNLFLRSYNNDPKGIFFRDGFEYGDTNQYNLSITIHDDGDGASDGMMISAYDGVFFNVQSGATPNTKFRILNNEVKAFANLISTANVYASGGNSTEWNTAYSWGDHSAAGYADSSHNHDSRYLVKGGSWNGVNMPGSRWGGFSVNGGEVVFQQDNPNNNQMSVMADGNFYAGERNGFWSLYSNSPHNDYNAKVGFYSNTSGHFLISTSAVYAGGNQVWHAGNLTNNSSNWDTAYGWGNHSGLYDAAGSASTAQANAITHADDRIDNEVIPMFAGYQPSGNYFTDGDTVLNMANNDGLVYNDTNNLMYVKADGTDYAIIDSRGGTITGTLTLSGAGTRLALNNGDITGVNQITINDPGEGIVWTSGSSGNITLAVTDDASDNILNLSGTGASLAVNGATVATQAWVNAQGFTTSTGSNYYLSGASFSTSTGVLTLTVTGASNVTVDLDGRFALGSDLNAVNDRIDNEVLPNIPTNNNQLTNGAGYITGYTETDTLASVTGRGNTTTNAITVGPLTASAAYFGSTGSSPRIRIYTEDETATLGDTFGDATSDKSYIYFDQGTSSNDPGFIMHETSNVETNEGVLHLVPSDDNSYDDYVSIHGTNDPDCVKIHTTGMIETSSTYQLVLRSGNGYVRVDDGLSVAAQINTDSHGDSSQWNTAYGWGDHAAAGYQPAGTYNTIIGTDSDINTSGATIIDNIYVTDGVITSMGTRTLTQADLGIPTNTSGNWWNGGYAAVGTDGVMEVGKYIDFHDTDTQTSDFSYRITNTGGRLYFSGDLELDGGDLYLNDGNTRLHEAGGNALKVSTNSGYIELGPMNTGHCHIQTDRTNFYFNTQIQVDTGKVSSYNEDLYLQRAGSTKITVGSSLVTFANHISVPQPAPPTFGAANIVGETIEVVFDQSPTSGVDSYQVWSSVAGGSYGLIANIPTQDIAATMTAIDAAFSVSGAHAYRVYAIKNGIYSDPAEGGVTFNASSLDVVNMSVVNLNSAYYIQYDMPSSRFVDHVEIYMDAEVNSANLTRTGATLIYSGNNTSYMYQIGASDLEKFHQFWVEVVES